MHLKSSAIAGVAALLAALSGGLIVDCTAILGPTNQSPIAVISPHPQEGYARQEIIFSGEESYDPDGEIVRYEWDFDGDGFFDSEEKVSRYTFPDDSDFDNDGLHEGYFVTLRVSDNEGASDTASIFYLVHNVEPVARFTYQPSRPFTGQPVQFDARDSYDPAAIIVTPAKITAYYWSFGDGSFGEGVAPEHRYIDNGLYEATLTVVDDDGAWTSLSQWIEVRNRAPTVTFTWYPCETLAIVVTGCVTFDAAKSSDPDGWIVSYRWDFGDGTKLETEVPWARKQLVQDVTYRVTLTVIDDDGAKMSVTRQVRIGGTF